MDNGLAIMLWVLLLIVFGVLWLVLANKLNKIIKLLERINNENYTSIKNL